MTLAVLDFQSPDGQLTQQTLTVSPPGATVLAETGGAFSPGALALWSAR